MTDKHEITLRFVTSSRPGSTGPSSTRTFNYRTMEGAQKRARALMGDRPRFDPDGYAVNKKGDCLFIIGVEDPKLLFKVPDAD